MGEGQPRLLGQVRDRTRRKHYSIGTEQAYVDWIRRFVSHHNKRDFSDIGAAEVEGFLTHLALRRGCRPRRRTRPRVRSCSSTRRPLESLCLGSTEKASTPTGGPYLQGGRIVAHLSGTVGLMSRLHYGMGMRIMECVRLRVKDVDLARCEIVVRQGKGGKDRMTVLPQSLVVPFEDHLIQVKKLHDADLVAGNGEVYLPDALARSYPGLPWQWAWQYVFASRTRSVDPHSGTVWRHHADEKALQRAMQEAVRRAGIAKLATPHTLRHPFATHLLHP